RDAGQRVQPVAVGHDHVRNHQIALALFHPPHQRHQAGGRMDLAARPRQRLGQHGADGAVVIGNENGSVHGYSFRLSLGAIGSDRRNTVRPGTESTLIQPSWSETIFDTSARPSPVPFSRPETKGSNTSAAMSGGRPGPSSMT